MPPPGWSAPSWLADGGRAWSASRHPRWSAARGSAGEEVAVLGVLVDELGHVPALGHDPAAGAPDVVEGAPHQLRAQTPTPQRGADLRVGEHRAAVEVA